MAGKYGGLTMWLRDRPEDRVRLSFSEIERILGAKLPKSARIYPAFWSAGRHVGRLLRRVDWLASLDPEGGFVQFRRSWRDAGASLTENVERSDRRQAAQEEAPAPDLLLVGCVQQKQSGRHRARELYSSPLFRGRRRYAEDAGCPWFILSAKYGLVHPDEVIESYDLALKDLRATKRRRWAHGVFLELERKLGSLCGRVIEIHAGREYVEYGLREALEGCSARVVLSLSSLRIGEQLAWYWSRPADQLPVFGEGNRNAVEDEEIGTIVESLTRTFSGKRFDLSARLEAPTPGWDGLPEFAAVKRLRMFGASAEQARIFLTLVAALDRARDADRLWAAAADLFQERPWVFDPREVSRRSVEDLQAVLARGRVSQRHRTDVAAWHRISCALVHPDLFPAVRGAVLNGEAEVSALSRELTSRDGEGRKWFPLLSGPKISVMWVRILVAPGGGRVHGLDALPVAVDVQVRRATENLGVTTTQGQPLDQARGVIQEAWKRGVHRAVGPVGLEGTCAALDPALWFLGKWGCSFCERGGIRLPVAEVCRGCRQEE